MKEKLPDRRSPRGLLVREASTLLPFLLNALSGISRTKAKQLLAQQQVRVDNEITTQFNTPLRPGQVVTIEKSAGKTPLRSRLVRIVYEDAYLLVVDKAPGIRTNTLPGEAHDSLKRILDQYVKRSKPRAAVHTVHRLDKNTSGLLIFAKRRDVQQLFITQWRELVSDRRYIALVEGRMEQDAGTVQSYLKENKMMVCYSTPTPEEGGQIAITHFRTLQRTDRCSLVELHLETGRKNQIRVHMHDLGHPICGDRKYGATTDPAHRLCLHAFKLSFQHPVTHRQLSFTSPLKEADQLLNGQGWEREATAAAPRSDADTTEEKRL